MKTLLDSVHAALATVSRELRTGAGWFGTPNHSAGSRCVHVRQEPSFEPSNVNCDCAVPITKEDTVRTIDKSAGVTELLCRQNKLVPDVHDAVPQPFSASCNVTVGSTVLKFNPDTVTL